MSFDCDSIDDSKFTSNLNWKVWTFKKNICVLQLLDHRHFDHHFWTSWYFHMLERTHVPRRLVWIYWYGLLFSWLFLSNLWDGGRWALFFRCLAPVENFWSKTLTSQNTVNQPLNLFVFNTQFISSNRSSYSDSSLLEIHHPLFEISPTQKYFACTNFCLITPSSS